MGKKDASGRGNSDVLVKVLQTRRKLQDWRCAGTGRHGACCVTWFGQRIGQGNPKQERWPLNLVGHSGWVLTNPRIKGGLCSAHPRHQEGSIRQLWATCYAMERSHWQSWRITSPLTERGFNVPGLGQDSRPDKGREKFRTHLKKSPALSLFCTNPQFPNPLSLTGILPSLEKSL